MQKSPTVRFLRPEERLDPSSWCLRSVLWRTDRDAYAQSVTDVLELAPGRELAFVELDDMDTVHVYVRLSEAARRSAKRAYRALTWMDGRVEALYADPVTSGMGAPVGEIVRDWEHRHMDMLARVLRDELVTGRLREMLRAALLEYDERRYGW
jgi:hypothetical protein